MKKLYIWTLLSLLLISLCSCYPLKRAVYKGDISKVQALLDQGADINQNMDGYYALVIAVRSKNIDMIKFLLSKGANINGVGTENPLYLAAAWGQKDDVFNLLVEKGADLDIAISAAEADTAWNPGCTPCRIALNILKTTKAERERSIQRSATVQAPPAEPSFVRSDIDDLPQLKNRQDKNAYAIVIGIEHYRQKLPNADYAISDARLVSDYLTKALGYPEENVITLLNEHATYIDMAKYLEEWLPKNTDQDSSIFIYYSGHGAPNPRTGNAFIVPYDGDPNFIEKTGYPLMKLYENLSKLPAKQVIVALDSCFSGAGGRSVLAEGSRPIVMNIQTNMALSEKLIIMAASSGSEISSSYKEKGHGLFTYFLLKGIKGEADANEDGKINIEEIYQYIKPNIQKIARRLYNNEQAPQLIAPKELTGLRLR